MRIYPKGGGVSFLYEIIYNCERIWFRLIAYLATFGIIVLFRVKVGANSWVFIQAPDPFETIIMKAFHLETIHFGEIHFAVIYKIAGPLFPSTLN